jgi:hypothetical protein
MADEQVLCVSGDPDLTCELVFQSSGPGEYAFKIKADGSVELGPKATLDQASKAFWDYALQSSPFLGAAKKQELRDWLQKKRAMDSRDLYAVELLNELEQILGS